jgi:hypothetical protein
MRSSYWVVLLTLVAIAGCDSLKGFMPGPTANKAVTVPSNANLVYFGPGGSIRLPSDAPGAYWIVEDDTSKTVSAFPVRVGQSSESALSPEIKDELDAKRKYRVYYVSNKNSTQPTTIPNG